jgi:hypothetical protein
MPNLNFAEAFYPCIAEGLESNDRLKFRLLRAKIWKNHWHNWEKVQGIMRESQSLA